MTSTKTVALHMPKSKKSLLAAKKLAVSAANIRHAHTKKLVHKTAPAEPVLIKKPKRFTPRTYALRAIRRLQSRSDRVCGVPMANMQRLVVNEMSRHVSGVRIGAGVIQGIRDVTEHFMHEVLKSARRLTQEQTHKAWTITGRSVQSAVARWAHSNPYFMDFMDAYADARDKLGLPEMEAKTDFAERGSFAKQQKDENMLAKVSEPKKTKKKPTAAAKATHVAEPNAADDAHSEDEKAPAEAAPDRDHERNLNLDAEKTDSDAAADDEHEEQDDDDLLVY